MLLHQAMSSEKEQKETFQANTSHSGPFRDIPGHSGPFRSILGHSGPFRVILGHSRLVIHYSDIHDFFSLKSFFDFPAPTRCCLVSWLGHIRRSWRWLVEMPQTFFFIHYSDIHEFFPLISFFDFPAPTRCCLVG